MGIVGAALGASVSGNEPAATGTGAVSAVKRVRISVLASAASRGTGALGAGASGAGARTAGSGSGCDAGGCADCNVGVSSITIVANSETGAGIINAIAATSASTGTNVPSPAGIARSGSVRICPSSETVGAPVELGVFVDSSSNVENCAGESSQHSLPSAVQHGLGDLGAGGGSAGSAMVFIRW
jgi:hypothetical protein